MMIRCLLTGLSLLPGTLFAWEFSAPITVSELARGVHHFQGTTARALAVSNNAAALVWEDNHTGTPTVYFAIKGFEQANFSAARQLSTDKPAFDPAIVSDGKRFVVMWESDSKIHGSVCDVQTCTAAKQLSLTPSRQVSLTRDAGGKLYFVWATRLQNVYQLQAGEVLIKDNTLAIHKPVMVTTTPKQAQSYPSITVLPQGWTVAFEDREEGHTRLLTAFRPTGKNFLAPQLLNDLAPAHDARYGAGTGAMRAQLTDDGKAQVVAVWLDKRDFEGGYDVYAARSQDGGHRFGSDEKVQDPLGDNQPQWHASIAMNNNGNLFSAWSDPRDGTLDIWYSTRNAQDWSDDEILPVEREGDQSHPALAFDARGMLHIAFIDQQTTDGNKTSRIIYLTAHPTGITGSTTPAVSGTSTK